MSHRLMKQLGIGERNITWSFLSQILSEIRPMSIGGNTPFRGLHLSPSSNQERAMNVFNRKAKRLQKDRSTLLDDYKVYDYIKDEVGYRLADRICDIKRTFDVAVDLGCGRGHVSKNIYKDMAHSVIMCELSERLLKQSEVSPEVPSDLYVIDEEFIPFKQDSIDLVVSSLSLHWVNNLPGCFRQIQKCLKNDGAFIGSIFGGETLYELRSSLLLAEQEREGGVGSHISPFIDIRDLGGLLNQAGFTMLTIDVDEMVINYPSMYELMYDLKGMAENNCAWNRKTMLHRETANAAAAIYKDMYGDEKSVPATFQVIYFIGWKPDPTQAKAAARGSGEVSLKDLDKLDHLVKEIQDLRNEKK